MKVTRETVMTIAMTDLRSMADTLEEAEATVEAERERRKSATVLGGE